MDTNPFEPPDFPTLENLCEESLDSLIHGIKEADRLSWKFNPWHHRVLNWFVKKLISKPKRIIYDETYIGLDRRQPGKLRDLVKIPAQAMRHMMLPKTEKIIAITSALLFFMVGCGVEPHTDSQYNRIISVEGFEHYVNLFQEQARELGQEIEVRDLVIRFKHIPLEGKKTILGQCWHGGAFTPTIHIDPDHWSRLSLTQRQLVMFHEMGHCILRRGHIEDFSSIMNPLLMPKEVFVKDESRFVAELFDTSAYGSLELREEEYDSDRHNSCPDFHSGILNRMGNEIGHP